jgi:ERCC4-type nuclease
MPLWVDSREPEDIVKLLKKQNLAIEVKTIPSGDYVFGEVAIERKTTRDLVNSVTSGERHFWNQLDTMKRTYQQPILLIEGLIDFRDRLLMGILTTVILFWKYQTVFSDSKQETAIWIERLFTKYGVGKTGRIPPAAVIRMATPKQIRWAMLQCIKGIGPKTASKILEEIPDIFLSPAINTKYRSLDYRKELKKVKGLKKESLELLVKVKSYE